VYDEEVDEVNDLEHQKHEHEKQQRAHERQQDFGKDVSRQERKRASKHRAHLLLIPLLFSSAARADVVKTVGQDLISPVTTQALTPLLVGAGLATTIYIFRAQISDPVQRSITTHRPLDKLAGFGNWAGQVYPNLIYTGYGVLSGLLGSERGYLRAEEMFLATSYSGLVASIFKVSFREARPNSPDGSDKKSMPSGHATTVFTFAGIVGAEHPWYIAVPAYTIAAITSYARINDNKHYLHDVIAGGTIGLSYALGVYYKRQERNGALEATENKSALPTFSVLPSEGLNGVVIGAAKVF
jgi:membrane-associated phospholipid phosphatase